MAADAMAPCVVKASAVVVSIMWAKQVFLNVSRGGVGDGGGGGGGGGG